MKSSLIKNPRPGDFAAVCRQANWMPVDDLPPGTDLDKLQSRWDKKRHCNVFLIPCVFETKVPDELEAHMRDVHGGGIYRWDNGSLSRNVTEVRNYTPRVAAMKPWSAPKLKADGVDFEPNGFAPGAEVSWPAGGVMDRSGQVWSAGHHPKSIWVIPDEPRMQEHPENSLVRFERAILLTIDRRGGLYEYPAETMWSHWAELEDVA